MDVLEVSAKTVEDAITKACVDMGLSSDQLDIQVISEGSTGFLGIGTKPAVIQVSRKEAEVKEKAEVKETVFAEEEAEISEAAKKDTEDTSEEFCSIETKDSSNRKSRKRSGNHRRSGSAGQTEDCAEKLKDDSEYQILQKKKEEIPERSQEEIEELKKAAASFLEGVFKAMDLPVELSIKYDAENGSLNVDMEGSDMGILIGKRGQTLDSLQYLTSLVVNKDQKSYIRVKLDTEDYRKRRKDTLENLAKNIANKVKRTGHSVSLEAMNPYERRIIHSAMQGNAYVVTYSEGNEPYRHVVIAPRRGE